MKAINAPTQTTVPFAASGTKNTIPVPSQQGTTPGAASMTDGFPPLTMQPIASGGIPPFGADMNGILNQLSAAVQWAQAGGQFPFNATFAAAIGGYPAGALVLNAAGTGQWLNTVDQNSTNPDAGGAAGWVAVRANSGVASLTATSGNVTPTAAQLAAQVISVTGTLTANAAVVLPLAAGATWIVANNTTGSFTLAVNGATGTGVTIPQGSAIGVYSDGTNFYATSASVTGQYLPINGTAVAATKLATARAFNLTGPVTASVVNFDGTGNVTLSTAIANNALSIAMTSGLQTALDSKFNAAGGTITGNVTVSGTANLNGPVNLSGSAALQLSITSSNAADTYFNLINTSTGGRSWAIGTAGQTPPSGLSNGDFFVWDNTGAGWRLRIDASGTLSTAGGITAAGTLTANQNVQSSTANVVIGTTGAGNVYLRPNGVGSTTGQLVLASNGNASIPGLFTANGGLAGVTSGSQATITATDTGGNGATLRLSGNGATTPNKHIRAFSGSLQVVNSGYTAVIFSMDDAGNSTFYGGASFSGGPVSSSTDLSKGIALYSNSMGFGITANRLNYVVPSANAHVFVVNGADVLNIAAGAATLTGNLTVTGTGNFQGSDRRLKRDLVKAQPRPIHRGLSLYDYTLIDSGEAGRGVLAQHLKARAPEYVGQFTQQHGKRKVKRLSVNYAGAALEVALWAANEVDRLTQVVTLLQRQIKQLGS